MSGIVLVHVPSTGLAQEVSTGDEPAPIADTKLSVEIFSGYESSGTDLSVRNDSSETLLHFATANPGNLKFVRALLNAGADPNAQGVNCRTLLHIAARRNENPSVVTALLVAGADPNARGQDDLSKNIGHRIMGEMAPLHSAAV